MKMKKIFNGKKYDTETAKLLGWNGTAPDSFEYWQEELYLKKTGEYFLVGEGGPLSKYAEYSGNTYSGGESLVPMSEEQARKWAENNLTADQYEEIFGEVEE